MREQHQFEKGRRGSFEPGIGDLVCVLKARKRMIAACAIAACALALAIALMLPDRYEAAAKIQLDPRVKRIVNFEGVLADLKTDAATIDGEVEIIRSRAIALKVIEQLRLREDAEFAPQPGWRHWAARLGVATAPDAAAAKPPVADDDTARRQRDGWSLWSGLNFGLQVPDRDEVARAFDSRLQVMRIRISNLIEIRFSSSDPVRSAQIVNAIANVYVRSQIEAKSRATEVAGELLEERLKGLREKVSAAEREVERYKAEHGIFDADGRLLTERQLQRETETLDTARAQTAQARARHEAARRMMLEGEGSEAIADVVQSSTVPLLREELAKALRREAEFGTRYGARHPEMQRIAADVAKAQSELTAEVGKITRALKTEQSLALEREYQIEQRIAALKQQINAVKDRNWKLRELEREATASRQLLEALLQRNKQTEETLGMQLPDARLVAPADAPLLPSAPNRTLIVIGAAVAGLLLGLGVAIHFELTSGGFLRAEQVEGQLHVRHLVSLPLLDAARGPGMERMRLMRQMIADPRGLYAESVRTLRHGLDAARRGRGAAIVLVTSSVAGEGKSVTASNLALHYALTGSRTLLVDADLRRRELTRSLDLKGQPGLVEVLADGMPCDVALLFDKNTGLYVMAAAARPDPRISPSELLGGGRTKALLHALRQRFDTIIVDAPPLLPVLDARILAAQADHIVIVARWRSTPRSLVRHALKSLGTHARKVAGVGLNQIPADLLASTMGYSARDGYDRPSVDIQHAA